MGFADVGADVFIAIGIIALFAGGAAPLSIIIASIAYICNGLMYAELTTIYPYAGGAQIYSMKAFNDLLGFLAGWALLLDYVVDISLFSLATTGYLSSFFPFFQGKSNLTPVISFFLVLGLIIINIFGIKGSSRFNETLVSVTLVTQLLILFLGFVFAFKPGLFTRQILEVGSPNSFQQISYLGIGSIRNENFLYSITLAMISFIGIESIAQAAEETRRPEKWIPRAYKLSILSVVFMVLGFSCLGMGILPWKELAGSYSSPLLAISQKIPFYPAILTFIVACVAVAICYVSTNTGVIGVSRVTYSMSKLNLFPKWFSSVHTRFKTPYRTIIIFGLIGGLLSFVGDLPAIADLYAFGALLSYIFVSASFIIIRNREKNIYRSWKVPGTFLFKVSGKKLEIPLVGVIGMIFNLFIWILTGLYHSTGRVLAIAWFSTGLAIYILYRKKASLNILSSRIKEKITPLARITTASFLMDPYDDITAIAETIRHRLKKFFDITVTCIIDPDLLKMNYIEAYGFGEKLKAEFDGNKSVKSLIKSGYSVKFKFYVGPMEKIVKEEALSPDKDVIIVLVKRKLLRRREEPETLKFLRKTGKLMVLRVFR